MGDHNASVTFSDVRCDMYKFSTEQFVPCLLPEITATIERTSLPNTTSPLYLQCSIYAIRMHVGWRLESSKGTFLVESLGLIQALQGKPACSICNNDREIHDLEQYYSRGLIGYTCNDDAMLNIFDIGDEYRAIYRNESYGWFSMIPTKIELDLTSTCNFACRHCSRAATPLIHPDELNLRELIAFLEQAGQIGVSAITFMGGEPTCHPELVELAIVARMAGVRYLSLGTNGWLLDEKLAVRLAAVFDSIQVSLHGSTAATHDGVVGQLGSFERSVQGIRYLKGNAARAVTISFTVTHDNIAEIESAASLAKDLGVNLIRFLVLTPKGRGINLPQWDHESRERIGATVSALREKFLGDMLVEAGGTSPYMTIPQNAAFYGCPAGRTLMYVSSSGDVKPCAAMEGYCGNIKESGIIDLWHSLPFVAIRKAKRCQCSYNTTCAGTCLAGVGSHTDQVFDSYCK